MKFTLRLGVFLAQAVVVVVVATPDGEKPGGFVRSEAKHPELITFGMHPVVEPEKGEESGPQATPNIIEGEEAVVGKYPYFSKLT